MIPARAYYYEGEERPFIWRLGVIGEVIILFTCPENDTENEKKHKVYASSLSICKDASKWIDMNLGWDNEMAQPCVLSNDGTKLALYAGVGNVKIYGEMYGPIYVITKDFNISVLHKGITSDIRDGAILLDNGYGFANDGTIYANVSGKYLTILR